MILIGEAEVGIAELCNGRNLAPETFLFLVGLSPPCAFSCLGCLLPSPPRVFGSGPRFPNLASGGGGFRLHPCRFLATPLRFVVLFFFVGLF